jgi:hypothetical protein
MATVQGADQHHEIVDVSTSKRPRVLMVVANPATSTTTGWPIGFWAASSPTPTTSSTGFATTSRSRARTAARSSPTPSPTRATSRSGRPTI